MVKMVKMVEMKLRSHTHLAHAASLATMNTHLRCRPGDLALVIRDTDAGKVVHCVELASATERAAFGIGDSNGPVWRIDRECLWADWRQGGRDIPLPYCPDAALVPIRPKPGKSAPSQRLAQPVPDQDVDEVITLSLE